MFGAVSTKRRVERQTSERARAGNARRMRRTRSVRCICTSWLPFCEPGIPPYPPDHYADARKGSGASIYGGAASDAPTPTPSVSASSASTAGSPSGRVERRLPPRSGAGDPLAVPATIATVAGIRHREPEGGVQAPDDERSREEGLGGRAPRTPSLVAATPQPSNMPSLRQHHDDIDEPLALHGRDGDAGSEGLDADAEAEAEAAAAAAAEAADFVSAEEWEAMRVATLAVQAPLPAPAEPQALTVQRPRRPGPPRKVTA